MNRENAYQAHGMRDLGTGPQRGGGRPPPRCVLSLAGMVAGPLGAISEASAGLISSLDGLRHHDTMAKLFHHSLPLFLNRVDRKNGTRMEVAARAGSEGWLRVVPFEHSNSPGLGNRAGIRCRFGTTQVTTLCQHLSPDYCRVHPNKLS